MAALLVAQAGQSAADDERSGLWADISIELQDDYLFRSSDPAQEFNDASATIEADLGLEYASGSGAYATIVFEPVLDPEKDRFFQGFGLYVEELFLAHDFGPAAIRLGKLSTDFGAANDIAPGLYGDEFTDDYELTERLGASVEVPFEALGGLHSISATAFFADTTPLSDSAFTSRGRLSRDDGGVSNTGRPDSFAITVAGEVGETGYNLGLRRQSAGRGDPSAEFGGVVGVFREIELEDVEVEFVAEAAYFPRYDGDRDSAVFATLGAEFSFGDVSLSAVYGLRDLGEISTDHLATVSLEYELAEGLSIGTGYRFLRDDGAYQHTVGLLLTYDFSVP